MDGLGVGMAMEAAAPAEDRWVQCDTCEKWRRVTDDKADVSGEKWYCHQNTWDPAHASCAAEEEPSSDGEGDAATLQQQQQQQQAILMQQQQLQQLQGQPKRPAPKSGQKRRKKKRGSDDDSEEDTSATNSADEAFYAAIDAGGRRSTRERRPPTLDEGYMHPDFEVADDDDYGSKSKRKSAVKAIPWTTDADDALLSAIVKHGEGHWTNMVTDPEFASRLAGHKATQLRARWRKLGTSEFNAKSEPADRHLAAKRDSVLDHIEATKPLPIQPSVAAVHYAPVQPQPQMMMAHPQMGVAPVAGASALPTPPPEPFTAYRPYVTHIFDLPKSTKAKKPAPGESAADAQLSTPMTGQPKARRRGRRPNNSRSDDESEFSDADSEDSEAVERRALAVAAKAGGDANALSNEFKDLEENLDNAAYMHYYDHRNDSLLLYDTFAVPLRDMKRQFIQQYGMKQQDALELIKAMSDAPDLYTRRNMLSKAVHAHFTHFQTAQMVRQWMTAVRQMTTQALHKTHDIKLRMDQQSNLAEKEAERLRILTPQTHTEQVAHKRAPPLHISGDKTQGLAALEKLPYYWRKKLEDCKQKGLPCPGVQGSTPSKGLLVLQLKAVEAEWDMPHMVTILTKHGQAANAAAAPATGSVAPVHAVAPLQHQHVPQPQQLPPQQQPPMQAHPGVPMQAQQPMMAYQTVPAPAALAAPQSSAMVAAQQYQLQVQHIQNVQQQQLTQLASVQSQMSPQQYQEAFAAITNNTNQQLQQLQQQQLAFAQQQQQQQQQLHAQMAMHAPVKREAHAVGSHGGAPLPNIFLRRLPDGLYQLLPHSMRGGGAGGAGAGGRAPKAKAKRKRADTESENDDDAGHGDDESEMSAAEAFVPNIRLRKAGEGQFTLVEARPQSHL